MEAPWKNPRRKLIGTLMPECPGGVSGMPRILHLYFFMPVHISMCGGCGAQQSAHEWEGCGVPDVATGVFSWEEGFRMVGPWED